MRRISTLLLLAALGLAACREGTQSPAPLPNPMAEASQSCTRSGGRMVNTGGKTSVCLHETRDAGKMCRRATDCEGDCLARSGTCAPARPMFGCHEILMNEGQRATLCRD